MKPLILLTNDDGIHSPGLLAMAKAVSHMGRLLIVAPNEQQTSSGRSFPRHSNLGVIEEVKLELDAEYSAFSFNGTPAYAVSHAVLELAERKPSLCLSGINYGENLGTTLTCSGTIGAILEADTHGIPGIAFSIPTSIDAQRSDEYEVKDWEIAKNVVSTWAEKMINNELSNKIQLLNINIPLKPSANHLEYRYTIQSKLNYYEFVKPDRVNISRPYTMKSIVRYDEALLEENSDIYATCKQNVISVTPIQNNLTFQHQIDGISFNK